MRSRLARIRAMAQADDVSPDQRLSNSPGFMGRLAQAGFEEVAIFSLRRAWRNVEKVRKGGSSLPNLRFFSAVQTLSETPSFQRFLDAMQQEGAA